MDNMLKNTIANFDGIAKSSLDSLKDENLIQFINHMFSKNFSVKSEVKRLSTESNTTDLKQKRCDYLVRIEDEMFLIEIQSYDDDEMAIRIFDYGFRGAEIHGKIIAADGIYEFNFPQPAVFYLRKGNKVLDKLNMRVKITPENTIEYCVRVIYIADYSFDDMLDNYMFPMLPFYSMRYENLLLNKHTEEDEKEVLSDLLECSKKLKAAFKKEIITGQTYHYSREWFIRVFIGIINKAKKCNTFVNEEEAYRVMQMMLDEPIEGFDIYKALRESETKGFKKGHEEGLEEGREEGITENKITTARSLLASGVSDDIIINCTGISPADFEKIKAETEKN